MIIPAKIFHTSIFLITFVGSNIACHANNAPDSLGENLGTYVERFCWIAGMYVSPESYGADQ